MCAYNFGVLLMYRFIFLLFFCFIQSEFVNLEKAKKVAINQIISTNIKSPTIEYSSGSCHQTHHL